MNCLISVQLQVVSRHPTINVVNTEQKPSSRRKSIGNVQKYLKHNKCDINFNNVCKCRIKDVTNNMRRMHMPDTPNPKTD